MSKPDRHELKRKHLSLRTKLASALLALGDVPYKDAKQLSEDQVLSLYQWDHGQLAALDGPDVFWNLTPRLIAPHREKSRKDTSIVAKVRRVESRWQDFTAKMAQPDKGQSEPHRGKPKRPWPKRKFPVRSK